MQTTDALRTRSIAATVVAGLLTVSCAATPPVETATVEPATATPATSPQPPEPIQTPLTALPAMGDVPTYKGNASRSSVHPGPGPIVRPVEAWSTDIGCAVLDHSPALGSGVVVIGCETHRLVALDALTGAVLWTAELAGPESGFSPAIEGDGVFVADTAGAVARLDLRTGVERWNVALTPTRNPVVVDGLLYVGTTEGRYVALDPADGSVRWQWQAPAGIEAVNGTVVEGVAYLNTNDGLLAVSIESGEELWRFRTVTGRVATPAIGENVIAVSALGSQPRGEVYGLDRSTGAELWRHPSASGNQIAPPAIVGELVVVPSVSDGVHAFDAHSGELRWQATTGANIGQAIAIAGHVVYLNTERSLAALSLDDGSELWTIDLAATVKGSPLVSGGMVFVGDDAGFVRAYAEPDLIALLPAAPTPAQATPAPPTAAPTTAPTPVIGGLFEVVATFDTETSDLDMPSGIAYAAAGELFVVNGGTHEILVLDPDNGAILRRWGGLGSELGQFNFRRNPNTNEDNLGGVSIAADGTVYVADSVNRRVQYFTPEGEYLGQWGRFGAQPGQFMDPIDVHVGPDGTVYVVDDQADSIQRFTADGDLIARLCEEGSGPGQCASTGGIFVGGDGTLYYSDWNNYRIQAWDNEGTWLWELPTRGVGPRGSNNPADLAVDDEGRIYLAMWGYLYLFSPEREFVGAQELGDDAWSVALGTDRYIYMTDMLDSKIYKLRPVH